MDPTAVLPIELVVQIFSYLYAKDKAAASLVSSAWCHVALDPVLWTNSELPHLASLGDVLLQPRFSQLRYLTVTGIDDDIVASIATNLTRLVGIKIYDATARIRMISDEACQNLVASLTQLEELSLYRPSRATAQLSFAIAEHLPRLRTLMLPSTQTLTNQGVCSIAKKCTRLEELMIRNCKLITAAAFSDATCFGNLTFLDVRGCDVPFATIEAFASHLPKLKTVLHVDTELQQLPHYATEICSNVVRRQIAAVIRVKELLALDKPPTNDILETGILPKLCEFIDTAMPYCRELRLESLRAILNLAAEEPIYVRLLINHGVVQKLLLLFDTNLCRDAAWAIGNIVATGRQETNIALQAGVISAGIAALKRAGIPLEEDYIPDFDIRKLDNAPPNRARLGLLDIELIRIIAWLFGHIPRNTLDSNVVPIVDVLSRLLAVAYHDADIVILCCGTFIHIAEKLLEDATEDIEPEISDEPTTPPATTSDPHAPTSQPSYALPQKLTSTIFWRELLRCHTLEYISRTLCATIAKPSIPWEVLTIATQAMQEILCAAPRRALTVNALRETRISEALIGLTSVPLHSHSEHALEYVYRLVDILVQCGVAFAMILMDLGIMSTLARMYDQMHTLAGYSMRLAMAKFGLHLALLAGKYPEAMEGIVEQYVIKAAIWQNTFQCVLNLPESIQLKDRLLYASVALLYFGEHRALVEAQRTGISASQAINKVLQLFPSEALDALEEALRTRALQRMVQQLRKAVQLGSVENRTFTQLLRDWPEH